MLKQTAQNFVRYFSALTELLEKLGKLCPIFKEFRDLWPHYEGLQDAVFEYYAQTVNFCTNALAFLRKSRHNEHQLRQLSKTRDKLLNMELKRQDQRKFIRVLGNGCIKGASIENGFKPAALQYSGATEYPGNSESGKTFIGYFFCTFSDHRSLKFEEIIRSLIKQVLSVFHGSTKFEEHLAGFFEQCNNIPSTDLWQDLFIRTCGVPKHIYLILDGIDEFYVSSRKEVYLTRNLPYALSISLDDIKCRPEIEGYIDASLKQRLVDGRLRIQDPAMVQEIKQALMVGVEGIQLNDEDIRETLRSLPCNLDGTYIRMLQRIVNDRNKDVAVEAFRWLTAASRPLSLRELVEAAVIRDDDSMQIQGLNRIPTDLDKVIEACGNFLMVAEPVCDSSNVRFIHSTVVTFLHTYQLPAQLEVFHIEPRTTEVHLAKRCLQYLHFRDIQTQLEPATVESISKPKQPSAVLAMPLSRWIPSEMQSGLVAAATRRTLEQPLASIAPKRANLKLFTSAAIGADTDALKSQTHKSTLRDYIIENWLNHCKVLPEILRPSIDQQQYWTWFRDFALNRFNLVKLPWRSDSPTADDPHHECFKWAAQNLHEGLVQLIFHEVASDGISPSQYTDAFLARASAGTKYEHQISEMPLLLLPQQRFTVGL
ncbi:hypothetical protein BDZ91DRAFT_766560 [Kalaharituber pfeilii]|nr:hypothetical protein BDZ91DRAFT_766560 [Kalaharituber pfeilii]